MASKKDRALIYQKYGGRCAYCGCQLEDGWHVDEVEPIRRNHRYDKRKGKWVGDGTSLHPERLTLANQVPACPSCNINKHSYSLEEFRALIAGFVRSLNRDSVQYKVAKRYGLIVETDRPIQFYFETITPPSGPDHD